MRERVERRQNLDTPLNRLSIAESDRVNVLLAAEGLKRATNIEIPFGESHPEFRATILSEDAMQLAITRTRQTLRTMGLVVARLPSQRNPGSDQIVYTARKQEDADRLAQLFPLNLRGTAMPEEIEELGKLFGFPKSAVEAYTIMSEQGKEELLMDASQLPPEIMNDESMAFLGFRLSKENWREEVGIVRKWAEAVKRRAPQLYGRRVEEYRKRTANLRPPPHRVREI